MNKFLLILLVTFFGGKTDKTPKEISSNHNQELVANRQQGMLIGEYDRKQLEEEPYASWYKSTYEAYTPKEDALETIKENISDYDITVLMGTWCHDSKRETPKLLKLLDLSNYDMDKLTLIGVDFRRNTPDNAREKYDVLRVPTIIFYKDGKEVNRFVEHAKQSLEEDIAKIVAGKEYSNSYAK